GMEVSAEQVVNRVKLLAAPALLDPTEQRVYLHDDPSSETTTLRWAKVTGGERYRLQIARTALFGELLLDKSDVRSASVQIPGLQEGNYYWRVSVIDAGNVESLFSELRKCKIASSRARHTADTPPPPLQVGAFLRHRPLVFTTRPEEQ